MTVKNNADKAISDLKDELDTMSFLDPGEKTGVDQDLIDDIQNCIDSLVTNYQASLSTLWGGEEHEPTAEEMAHWLFDGEDPSEHGITMSLYPTNGDEALVFTTDVPFPWR